MNPFIALFDYFFGKRKDNGLIEGLPVKLGGELTAETTIIAVDIKTAKLMAVKKYISDHEDVQMRYLAKPVAEILGIIDEKLAEDIVIKICLNVKDDELLKLL